MVTLEDHTPMFVTIVDSESPFSIQVLVDGTMYFDVKENEAPLRAYYMEPDILRAIARACEMLNFRG